MTPAAATALAERRSRLRRIRQSVVATALAVFVALFSTIYVQMAEGHDPALAKHSSSSQQSAANVLASAATTDDDDDGGGGAPAVTTSQS